MTNAHQTAALSLRGVEREYQLHRSKVAEAIRAGELPASRLGARRLLILRADVERWIRAHQVPVEHDAEAIVERALRRRAS